MLDHVFEPFVAKQPGEGTGLGLSLAYNIVKNHGGHMVLTSEAGSGTRVRVMLPVLDADSAGVSDGVAHL